jgi:hypothetical protein
VGAETQRLGFGGLLSRSHTHKHTDTHTRTHTRAHTRVLQRTMHLYNV